MAIDIEIPRRLLNITEIADLCGIDRQKAAYHLNKYDIPCVGQAGNNKMFHPYAAAFLIELLADLKLLQERADLRVHAVVVSTEATIEAINKEPAIESPLLITEWVTPKVRVV